MKKRFLLGTFVLVCLLMLAVGLTACGQSQVQMQDNTQDHIQEHNHVWGEYIDDVSYHHRTCQTCGEVEQSEHNFCNNDPDSGLTELCVCGAHQGDFASFKVNFVLEEGVSVRVYQTQDATTGYLANFAYARDSVTGTLLNDGNGQVNFEVVLPMGRLVSSITVTPQGNYKNLKEAVKDGNPLTYRLTKITGSLTVTITTGQASGIRDFASSTDDDGVIKFAWHSDYQLDYVNVAMVANDAEQNFTTTAMTWETQLTANTLYNFTFTAYYDGREIDSIACSRYYNPEIKNIGIPRVEITTASQIWPTCDYVASPAGCWGGGITNNKYVYATVAVYDHENTLLYNSIPEATADPYAGARIKVRGNTSAYSEKKPYKIKLSSKTDLLAGLVPDRNKADADKEWLLLASGASLNQVIGATVSETVQMDWTPSYSYVSLYVNGDYRGFYILCESVKQGNSIDDEQSRCAVADDGFVIELDAYWWNEDLYFTTPHVASTPMHYTFKFPDADDIDENSAAYQYIKKYITDFENALLNDNESYQDFIDEESFAKWLFAHDILGTWDSGGANIYLTKKDSTDSSKLKMGPLWDFDTIMWTSDSYARIRTEEGGFFFYYPLLLQNDDFTVKYNTILLQAQECIMTNLIQKLNYFNTTVFDVLVNIENSRWKTNHGTFDQQKEKVVAWLEARLLWLAKQN